MTQEEKAKELGQKYFPDSANIWARGNVEAHAVESACMEMHEWTCQNLWKDAQGDDLPEIDREVIVLVKALPEHEDSLLKVSFGHRPNPDGWNGKNIITGEVSHFEPKTYDKGAWSLPDAVYWLDLELPFKEK